MPGTVAVIGAMSAPAKAASAAPVHEGDAIGALDIDAKHGGHSAILDGTPQVETQIAAVINEYYDPDDRDPEEDEEDAIERILCAQYVNQSWQGIANTDG